MPASVLLIWLGFGSGLPAFGGDSGDGVRVQGPKTQPEVGFACCEHGLPQAQALFDDGRVVADLKALHASVAVPIEDFTAGRAEIVRRLNASGIPVIAWLMLSARDGSYLNAGNLPEAWLRFAQLQKWTDDYGLHWSAIGLDIEPNFSELSELKGHWGRMAATLARRSFDRGRVARAQKGYAALIAQIQSQGYAVQTYQMPFLADERMAKSSFIDRLLGTVDVRGNQEYLMLYTSFAPAIGAGIIVELGPEAQGITVGVTGTEAPDDAGALSWDQLSRDLIVASHFTRHIGVYDLEGCVRQGFLDRLTTFDWSQSVVVPGQSIRRARRLGEAVRLGLWIGDNIVFVTLVILLLMVWMIWCVSVWLIRRVARLRRMTQAGRGAG